MTTLSFTQITQGISSLTFQEGKIKNGAIAIGQGFKTIRDEGLWKFKTDNDGVQKYTSFKEYCEFEWSNDYAYGSIKNLLTSADCANRIASGTQSPIDDDVTDNVPTVPAPTKKSQTRALSTSGATEEDQGKAWADCVADAGGDPNNVKEQDLKDKLDEYIDQYQELPLGCPVLIRSNIDGMVYDGYEGHVVAYEAKKCVTIDVMTTGGKKQKVTALTNWLVRLQGPCIRLEPPTPKNKKPTTPKRSPEQWKVEAIALFKRVLEEGESGLCGEIEKFLER